MPDRETGTVGRNRAYKARAGRRAAGALIPVARARLEEPRRWRAAFEEPPDDQQHKKKLNKR